MEQRFGNTLRMTVNEKKFIETALLSDLRVDGRSPFDYRGITIKFDSEDGSSEVQLGQTHVMGFVTAQLVQPYRDRPNEGTLSIYTEFSPMADPSFEAGRPGESAVELGRIIDRGLRESRAVDTESLCVSAGKIVWSIRIDLHILDNGGNLVDAANIAALAALSTFRRPECTLGGGEDGQDVIVHPPEPTSEVTVNSHNCCYCGDVAPLQRAWTVKNPGRRFISCSNFKTRNCGFFRWVDGKMVREPLPLIIHHLPIAVTFAFLGKENTMVIDPTHYEEAVMGGRMTATLNTSGDVCAIQKAGGEGVLQSVIMQCLRIASVKAADVTSKIKDAVESYNTERALQKIKRHTSSTAIDVNEHVLKGADYLSEHHMERLTLVSEECSVSRSNDMETETQSCQQDETKRRDSNATNFVGGPSCWDPYSKGIDFDALKASLASRGSAEVPSKKEKPNKIEVKQQPSLQDIINLSSSSPSQLSAETSGAKTLKDAIKPKHKRKKKNSSSNTRNAS